MERNKRQPYSELSTVESQRNEITAEEFPEGSYGSDLQRATSGKSTPWRQDQKVVRPFGYENKSLHEDLPRNADEDDRLNDND